jgi:hypothetical protein
MPNHLTVTEHDSRNLFRGYQFYVSFYSLEGASLIVNPLFKEAQMRVRTSKLQKTLALVKVEDVDDSKPQDNPFYEYYQRLQN